MISIISLAIAFIVMAIVAKFGYSNNGIETQLPESVVMNEIVAVRAIIVTANLTQEQACQLRDQILTAWKNDDNSIMRQLDRKYAK